MTRLRNEDLKSVFNFRLGKTFASLSATSSPALGPNKNHIESASGLKRSGHKAEHSPSTDEAQESVELYLHSPIRLHQVVLKQEQGKSLL